eukprot:TRINITY_DN2657_c0_g1_i5.p1 TRINITY_DN2657_c0_g1~~TRINITY_DN2657_c0_g1_i5.p1  ORF type:complete len:660 (-),score=267.88 TRINITY_DN2657_c0_g1_i5:140-2098(-)
MEFGLKENQGGRYLCAGGPSIYFKRLLLSKKRRNQFFTAIFFSFLFLSLFVFLLFSSFGGQSQDLNQKRENNQGNLKDDADLNKNSLQIPDISSSSSLQNGEEARLMIQKMVNVEKEINSIKNQISYLQKKLNQMEDNQRANNNNGNQNNNKDLGVPSRRGDRIKELEFEMARPSIENGKQKIVLKKGKEIDLEPLRDKEEQEKEEIPVLIPPHVPQNQMEKQLGKADIKKRDAVKEAMKHAWKGYESFAWGYDEVAPIKKKGFNWLGNDGLATTMVDSLDTLLIMGLNTEYKKARDWLVSNLQFNGSGMTSLMEATIRVIGGFLSAYELTGEKDEGLLGKAKELGDLFLKNFETPSGIPYSTMILNEKRATNPSWSPFESPLSEVTTIQLEFIALSHHTGNPIYKEKALKVYDILNDQNVEDGLFSVYVDVNSGKTSRSHITLGALGDSFYEYMLKVFFMTGDSKWEKMYQRSAKGIIDKLIHYSSPNKLTFIAELINGNIVNKMDHLVCFAGGMFGMGAKGQHKEEHMKIATGITETCFQMYARMKTGIAPEIVRFETNENDFHPSPGAFHYILRPETVESLFYMWRLTHNQKYRDQGWIIFQNLEKHLRVEHGYSGIRDVQTIPVQYDDEQRSFFLAETLKVCNFILNI